MVGVSAGLIPFLEHDDANRALMGSNMQRQAVPLLVTEPPIVGTGLEKEVARHSRDARPRPGRRDDRVRRLRADQDRGKGQDRPRVRAAEVPRAQRADLPEPEADRPRSGQKVKKGQILADGAATHLGELALGRNVLVAFMSWEGYNFEDAIIISERLVQNDTYTSLHIEEFEIEIRETKLGKEEFTKDIPNVSPKALNNLDDYGIVRVGTFVKPGDILVGKVSPKSRSELTPEEKLLHAIFGRAGEDVKNDSLEVQSGRRGHRHRRPPVQPPGEHDRGREEGTGQAEEGDHTRRTRLKIAEQFREFIKALEDVLDKKELKDPNTGKQSASEKDDSTVADQAKAFKLETLDIRTPDNAKKARKIYDRHWERHPVLHRRTGAEARTR